MASELARRGGLPLLYLSANSGARLGLAEEIKHLFHVAWEDPENPDKGFRYLFLSPDDFKKVSAMNSVHAELIYDGGEPRYKILTIIGMWNISLIFVQFLSGVRLRHSKFIVFAGARGQQCDVDLCFDSSQPNTSLHCENMDMGLVHRAMCLFAPQLLSPIPDFILLDDKRHVGVNNLPIVITHSSAHPDNPCCCCCYYYYHYCYYYYDVCATQARKMVLG